MLLLTPDVSLAQRLGTALGCSRRLRVRSQTRLDALTTAAVLFCFVTPKSSSGSRLLLWFTAPSKVGSGASEHFKRQWWAGSAGGPARLLMRTRRWG